MVDAYFIGHLVGRFLASIIIVYLMIFVFSKFNMQVAWCRMKTLPAVLVVALVLVLPILTNVGEKIS